MVQYRQLQSPVELNTNVPDSGAASAYQSLAATFKDFSNRAFDVAGAVNAKAGEDKGAAEGAAGKPQPLSGWREMTAYGKAYNSAAEATYVAKTHIDAQNTLAQIEQETEGNLPAYRARATAYVAQLQKSTPAQYWPKLEPLINGRMVAGGIKVHGEEIAQQGQDQLATHYQLVPALINGVQNAYAVSSEAGDKAMAAAFETHDASLLALSSGPGHHPIDAVKAEQLRTQFTLQMHQGLEQQHIAMLVDPMIAAGKADVEKGDAMMQALWNDNSVDPEIRAKAQLEYQKQREQNQKVSAQANAGPLGQLEQSVVAGAYGPQAEDILRTFYRAGAIPESEFQTKMGELQRNADKHAADRAAMAAVEAAAKGGYGLDPKNVEQRKAVDIKFQADMSAAGVQPGDERWISAASVMLRNLNILPASAESFVRTGIMSQDYRQAVVASGAYARFRDSNPTAALFNDDPKIRATAEMVNSNLAANMTPEAAYSSAMTVVNMPEEQKAVLHASYGKQAYTSQNSDWLRSNVLNKNGQTNPGVFNNTPNVPVTLQAEFEQQVRQYYDLTGGDIAKARQLAGDAVIRNGLWGRTEVNGQPELIKYGAALPAAPILRADIATKLKDTVVMSPDGHGTTMLIDPATVRLVQSPLTDFSRGQHWGLQTVDQYGSPTPVLDKYNRPFDYVLPTHGAEFDRAQAQAQALELAKNKADRLMYLQTHPAAVTNAEAAVRAHAAGT